MRGGEAERILTAPLGRLCVALSLPAVAGLMLVGAATFADAAFVGRMSGADELGAVLIGFPVTMVASAVSALVGSGCAAILSRALGANDRALIAEAYGAFAAWTLLTGLVVTVLGVVFARPVLAGLGAIGPMLAIATRYTQIVMAGTTFVSFVFGASFLIRGEGRVTDAMVLLSGGSLLNVALDALFVARLGWGAEGAAYATLITQVATCLVTVGYTLSGRIRVPLRGWRWSGARRHALFMLRDGAAASLLYGMGVAQQGLVFRACARWGSAGDVVFAGAYLRLLMVGLVPAWGVAMAIGPVAGMAFGNGDAGRARRAMKVFALWATVATSLVWIVAMLVPDAVLGTLIRETEIIAQRRGVFRLLLASFPTLALQLVGAAYLSAVGRGVAAAVVIACKSLVFLGLLLWLLPLRFGLDGVWAALVGADVGSWLVVMALLGRAHKSAATNTESAADS